MVYTVKSFNIVNETEVDVFLEFSSFFYDPADVGTLLYVLNIYILIFPLYLKKPEKM